MTGLRRTTTWASLFLLTASLAAQDIRQEERDAAKYYQKWMNQDVVYLISDEERDVFSKLSTDAERDQFIEQFWQRRDPDLTSAINEYKEEHYRRLAYVNQFYGSGIPGWKTDRGRIYITFGPPAQVEYHPGGTYERKPYEGGGQTATFPHEVWTYDYIPGLGGDIEIEFVDRSFTGEFKMALYAWEKDMFLQVDGLGETTAERLGLANRAYRPGLHPGLNNNVNFQKKMLGLRKKDQPMERALQFFKLQKPPKIEQKELQTIVNSQVNYDVLPVFLEVSHIWVDSANALVPITLEVPNDQLEYLKSRRGYKARIGIYGKVTAMSGRTMAEFEEVLASEYSAAQLEAGKLQRSVFQKIISAAPGRHKIELVVKDLSNGNIGTAVKSVHVPGLKGGDLVASPMVLAQHLDTLDAFPENPTTFVIGDVRVIPNVTRRFKNVDNLGIYCQIHNPSLDSSTLAPKVEIRYEITRKGKLQTRFIDRSGRSIEYASGERLVLVRKIPLADMEQGDYEVTIRVNDLLSGQTAETRTTFQIVG